MYIGLLTFNINMYLIPSAVLNVSKLGQWYKSLCQKILSTPTVVAPTENTQAIEENNITIPDTGLVYDVL